MANRNFNKRQALEKECKELHAAITPAVLEVDSVATINVTTDIVLTNADAEMTARNSTTFQLVVLTPAGNDDDEVLVAFTGTAAAIVCTVTPNDGSNNGAVAVDLDEDELTELINSGVVVGKTIVLTDASSLRELQTATGGAAADALAPGDNQTVTFASGVTAEDAAFVGNAFGFQSVERTDVGEYLVTLDDSWNSLRAIDTIWSESTARDLIVQVTSEDVADSGEIVLQARAGVSAAELPDTGTLLLKVELKNSSVG